MTLSDLLVALKDNTRLYIELVDGETELISFNAAGYASIEDDLGARTVESITIESATIVVVNLVPVP